ncbi:MAG: hypothetical protein QXU40_01595, partial [Candidatus Pacearchaeota archaeon]
MNKSYVNKIVQKGLVSLFFFTALSSGCGVNIKNISQKKEGNFEFKEITQDNYPYCFETVMIEGQEYYIEKLDSLEGREEYLPFKILEVKNSDISILLDNSETDLISKKNYIPIRVGLEKILTNEEASINLEKRKINLSGKEDNKTGITKINEKNIKYSIKKIKIYSKDFFFSSEKFGVNDKFYLPLYLIPEDGINMVINLNNKKIEIKSKNIYRPLLIEHITAIKYSGKELFGNRAKYPDSKYYVLENMGFRMENN